jgi:membrane protease YdiL (CAAX protease family)
MVELRIREDDPVSRVAREPRGWWVEFDRWASPAEEEGEASIVPVVAILGVALIIQYLQLWLPPIEAFLRQHDVLYRAHWAAFTIGKQLVLLAVVWVVLRASSVRFTQIGFPVFERHRTILAVALVGLLVAVAVLHRPAGSPSWMVPVDTGERLLWVGLVVTAAVVEEIVFRGFAVVWTYRWGGHLGLAIGLPAVVFAVGHAVLSLTNVATAFIAAVIFSLLFVWRRDLYWPMVLHLLVNSVDLLI